MFAKVGLYYLVSHISHVTKVKLYYLVINHGRTVQRKTTMISFTCIAEINYIHKVINSNTQ